MATARAFDFTGKDQAAAPPKELAIKAATVFVSRTTVRSVVVREMKNYGILTVTAFDTVGDVIEDLRKYK